MSDDSQQEPWFAIERTLRDDDQGRERDTLLRTLEDQELRVKRQLDIGVAPDEYARLTRVREGLAAAAEVVSQVWRRYHRA